MKNKQAKVTKTQVFSHPIRKMNADELKKVVVGNSAEFAIKSGGGQDNQGRAGFN